MDSMSSDGRAGSTGGIESGAGTGSGGGYVLAVTLRTSGIGNKVSLHGYTGACMLEPGEALAQTQARGKRTRMDGMDAPVPKVLECCAWMPCGV